MRIKVGDRIRFLNDVGGGRVKRLLYNQMVEIHTDDGWDVPSLISELVIIPDDPDHEPYKAESNPVVEKKVKNKNQINSDHEEFRVFILAVQNHESDNNVAFSGLKWYLVNDSSCKMKFAFYQLDDNNITLVEEDELEAGTKMLLQDLSLPELSLLKGFQIQGFLSNSEFSKIPPLIGKYIPLNVKKFASAGAYTENDYLHEPAIVFNAILSEDKIVPAIVEDKDNHDDQVKSKIQYRSGKQQKVAKEVDLHVNQLVDSVVGLSNREILRIQMDRFSNELNEAIKTGALEIIFIHGIGNGTLKETLRKSIDADYPVCSLEDASFKEYGFGATMVRIRQNR